MNTLQRVQRDIPSFVWNLLAAVFAGLSIFALTLEMADESGAPQIPLRLALTTYGIIALYAAGQGRLWKRFGRWCIATFLGALGLLLLFGLLASLFCHGRTDKLYYSQWARVSPLLKSDGEALLEYARTHGDILPPQIDTLSMPRYLPSQLRSPTGTCNPLTDPISGCPFVWRRALSGVSLKQIDSPAQVIVAYSPLPDSIFQDRYVLFLDNRVERIGNTQLRKLIEKQRFLLPRRAAGKNNAQP